MKRISSVLAFAALMFAAGELQAAPVFHVAEDILPGGLGTLQAERAVWAAAHGGPLSTEGFEGLAAVPPVPFDFGDFTLSFSGSGLVLFGANALVRTEGVNGLGFTGDGIVTFSFDNPITAFGIDWSSFDQLATVISYSDDTGSALADVFAPVTGAGAGFFGVRDAAGFSAVTFAVTSGEIIEFDNIQYGSGAAVPEPSSLALLAMGACVAGAVRRHRSRRVS